MRPTPPRYARPATRLQIDGVDVAVYREGRGPPALLLPSAWGTGAALAIDAIGPARKYLELVSFDPPGVGLSGPARGERDLGSARVAEIGARVLDALDLADVLLVGHSNGALAALAMLAAGNPRVARAALVAAFARWERPAAPADPALAARSAAFHDAWRAVAKGGGVADAARLLHAFPAAAASEDAGAELVLEALAQRERAEDVAARLPAAAREARSADFSRALGDVRVPTWVVLGEGDLLVPPAATEALARGIPGARLTRVKGASHYPHLESAARFHHALRAFALGATDKGPA